MTPKQRRKRKKTPTLEQRTRRPRRLPPRHNPCGSEDKTEANEISENPGQS